VTIRIAADSDASAWDAYVASRPDRTGYHVWAWRRVFARAFGHESIYLMAGEGDRVTGVLPLVYIESAIFGRSMTSLPFVNYAGVLADTDEIGTALVEAAGAEAHARKCRHVELRHMARHFPSLPCRQHKVTMHLALSQGMWDRLDRKVRNQIRKAQKSGLVAESGGVELRPDFYAVFARNMRDLGTPVYSPRVFDEVLATFPDATRLHVVRLEGKPVAAGLTFTHDGTVEVPWASSVRDYNALCPNHLLYWDVMERAVTAGCHTLDFGRSTPGEGTFKFKEQWGARPIPLHWEYRLNNGASLPNLGPANPKYRLVIEAWKRLPLPIATSLGPHIVRSIP
jgi:FemAB-related protein (PEP-CTERM system-associated)